MRSRWCVMIFLVALALRLALFWASLATHEGQLIPTIQSADGYWELSLNVAEGRGFSTDLEAPFRPNPLRTPLYPIFLTSFYLLFRSWWAPVLAQIILGSLIPVLAYIFALQFLGKKNERLAWWVSIALAIEPFMVLTSFVFLTETLFTFLFLLSLILLFRFLSQPRYITIAGSAIAFSAALLVKPTLQFLPFVLPFILGLSFKQSGRSWRASLKYSAVFIAICLITISPWWIRNYKAFGVGGLSAQAAFNLHGYLLPSVLSLENGTTYQEELDKLRATGYQPAQVNLANARQHSKTAIDEIKKYPGALFKSVLVTEVTFFTHDAWLDVVRAVGWRPASYPSGPTFLRLFSEPGLVIRDLWPLMKSPLVVILAGRLIWLVIALLFAWGAVLRLVKTHFALNTWLVLGLIAYFALTTAVNGLGVNGRLRLPVNPLILSVAAYGIAGMKKNEKTVHHYPLF